MKKNILLLGLIVFLTFPAIAQPLEGLHINKAKYVIADNDDHRDVYTDEYLLALSSLKEINLLALITTYSPNEREYNLFANGRKSIVDKANKSGMTSLPKVFAGTNKRLIQPVSNKIEDTQTLDLDASQFIVEQAKRATKRRPIVFVAGGQLTAIANAYLLDSTIADKIIVSGVFGVQKMDYNAGLDGWAWKIVLSKFKVLAIPIGPSNNRGTVYMKAAEVPKEDIMKKLPQEISFFQWMYKKKHPSNALPDNHDYDGQAAIPLMRLDYITKTKRWTVTGIDKKGQLKLVEDNNGNIYEALNARQEIATEEFWRVMIMLAEQLE